MLNTENAGELITGVNCLKDIKPKRNQPKHGQDGHCRGGVCPVKITCAPGDPGPLGCLGTGRTVTGIRCQVEGLNQNTRVLNPQLL